MAARANVAAGHVDRGETLLDEVEARFKTMFPPGHQAFAAVATDRVRVAVARGDLNHALAVANAAMSLLESHPRYRSSIPLALRRRAEILLELGHFSEARQDAERMVALAAESSPADLPSAGLGTAYLALGEALNGEHRDAEARAALERAITHLEVSLGREHPETTRARWLLQRGR